MKEFNKKEKEFFDQVFSVFYIEYHEPMKHDFFDYWTEPNKSGTKLRWELEKTWDTGRRLKTWARNNQQWNKKAEFKPVEIEHKHSGQEWAHNKKEPPKPSESELAQIEKEYQEYLAKGGKIYKPNI